MKIIIIALIAFAGAAGLATFTKNTNGYVRIHLDPYTIDANLWVFILAAIILFVFGYIFFRLLGWIFGTKRRVGSWRQKKNELKAGKSMQKGYIDLIEGKWDSAEKQLIAKVDKSPAPVLNYLAAAHAAQQNGEPVRRDQYLKMAYDKDPSSKVAVDLTQARMQYESGDLDEARNTLIRLLFHVPKNEQVQRMLLAVNRERGDWKSVLEQLPKLRKVANFSADEANACERESCINLLEKAHGEGIEVVEKIWGSLTKKQRLLPELVNQYAYELLEADKHEQCENLLRQSLRKSWDSDLAYTYGLVEHNATRQLRLAEGWLKNQSQDPNLLLTLGRLAVRSKSWDKARNYYQQAITAGASQEANRELGQVFEDLGESGKALEYYRSGLEQALPAPQSHADDQVVDVEVSDETIIQDDSSQNPAETARV